MTCTVNAVVNDGQYMLAPSLQQGFLDIRTGLPLSGGIVTFYRDVDHTTLKPIFTISGPPDAPIFTQLPNPLTLSSIGTFQDPTNNQDIIPYYFPYDADGNVDLYYITVYSSDGFLQFTRDHFPSVQDVEPTELVQAENYIPNGQFLLHLDLPNNGLINRSGIYAIAYGPWQFIGGNSTNYLTFPRFDSPINNPVANPRYYLRLQCTVPNPAESRKDISALMEDVNFLQGTDVTYQVTSFTNDGSNHTVTFIVRQSFGSGGSTPIETVIGTFVTTPATQSFLFNFTVPTTIGKTLGSVDDDHFELILRSPISSTSDISYVNTILVSGTFLTISFPNVSPEQTKAFALPGSFDIPAFDGSDAGKVVTLGFSHENLAQELGFIYQTPIPSGAYLFSAMPGSTPPSGGYLYCDGSSYAVQSSPNATVTAYTSLFSSIGYASGTGLNGFKYAAPTGNVLPVTWCRYDVAQPNPMAGNSGFTFTLVQACTPTTLPQIYNITTVSAASISPGDYFILPVNTSGPQFVQMFWFTIDGAGTIPNLSYDVATLIPLLSSYTSGQVATIVSQLANGVFQVPEARGLFPRVWTNTADTDPDASTRTAGGQIFTYQIPNGNSGDKVGSIQADEFASHNHPGSTTVALNVFGTQSGNSFNTLTYPGNTLEVPLSIAPDGGAETRPVNFYVNCFIKT